MTTKEFLIKSLVKYETQHDSALPAQGLDLSYGEVVCILNSYDKNWWKACKIEVKEENNNVTVSKLESESGLIPSENRYKSQKLNKRFMFDKIFCTRL